MQNPPSDTRLIPLAEAADRFGYKEARYFRTDIAPQLGLRPVMVGKRWFLDKSRVDAALAPFSGESGLGPVDREA